jgi:hypothetical protein
MPNIGFELDLRARTPTLFEQYRRAHPELPKEKTWAYGFFLQIVYVVVTSP